MSNEQLAISKNCCSQAVGFTTRCLRVAGFFTFLFVHCYLLFVSCNLFYAPKDIDYWEKIEEEIRWANADQLKITVAYHEGWGSSPQIGLDRCFDAVRTRETPRSGYPFNLEFSPNALYGSPYWRAYLTDSLPEGWEDNPLVPELLSRTPLTNDEEVSFSSPRGSSITVTVWITEPVTIVPYSKPEPRILEIFPPFSREPDANNNAARTQEITITFAAALDPDTVIFGNDNISITCENDDYSGYYGLHYDLWRNIIRITPGEGASGEFPPAEHIITIRLGEGIQSMLGNNPMATMYEFSFSTTAITPITVWNADYDGNTVTVSWDDPNNTKDSQSVSNSTAWFRMNGGMTENPETIESSGNNRSFTIPNVPPPDDGGVRSGINVRDIREYQIFLETSYDESFEITSFKIWNIPGVIIHNEMTLFEIRTQNELNAIRDADNPMYGLGIGNARNVYVLVNDIEISDHIPIGTKTAPFTGRFYGNGHTVTIRSFAENGAEFADIGLFGVVYGGTVQDLTVVYETAAGGTVEINPSGEARFGGIAGTTSRNAHLVNVLVKGELSYTVSGDNTIFAGGIVGLMTGTGTKERPSLKNAYSGLNLRVEKAHSGTASGSIYLGGIAGCMGEPGTPASGGNAVRVEYASVVGDLTVGSKTVGVNVIDSKISGGGKIGDNDGFLGLFVGGLAGFIRGEGSQQAQQAALLNSDYRQGTIFVHSEKGSAVLGGAVGRLYVNAVIKDSSALQGDFEIIKTDHGTDFYIGGFIGNIFGYEGDVKGTQEVIGCYSDGPVVTFADINSQTVNAGGFAGGLSADVSYCYAKGNVSVEGGIVNAGGFVGQSTASHIKNCFAAGTVNAIGKGQINVGGFAGNASNLSDCYALGDVFHDSAMTLGSNTFAGGLVGTSDGTVERCFATGSVAAHSDEAWIYAGGLTGQTTMGSFINNAALGTSVVTTTNNINKSSIGRIGGSIDVGNNNHAYNGLFLYASFGAGKYGDPQPGQSAPDWTTHDQRGGKDASLGNIRTSSFWTNSPPDSGPPGPTHGLGFKAEDWIFTTVGYMNHPILRASKNGPAMGGQ